MIVKEIGIHGENLDFLPYHLKNKIPSSILIKQDSTYIIVHEKYYFWNFSNIMFCINIYMKDEKNCSITIFCGGGPLFSFPFPISMRIKEIIGKISSACDEKNWKMTFETGVK